MMLGADRRKLALDGRWLLGAPMLGCAVAVGLCAVALLVRAAEAMHEHCRLRRQLEIHAVFLAAEAAAAAYVDTAGAEQTHVVDAGRGIRVRTRARKAPGTSAANAVQLETRVGSQHLDVSFPLLPGGTAFGFGLAFATRGGQGPLPAGWPAPVSLADVDWPQLRPEVEQRRSEPLPGGFARDNGIALLHLPAGTDREDYVLGAASGQRLHLQPRDGLCVVPGDLWIAPGDSPLELELDQDVTVVAMGNLYVGRSVRITGRGCLTIAAAADGGVAFDDRDGNGRWTAGEPLCGAAEFRGPLEGAGNVYLGMPRGHAADLELDLGLAVSGHLHVAADHVAVHGPLLLGAGGSVLPGHRGRLEATGRRLPALQRSVLPGFVAVGAPRPGPVKVEIRGQEALYLAVPTR